MNTPPPDMTHYLVIDQGGHASRAILFNASGDILHQASVEIETLRPQTNYVEHDPQALIKSICQAVSRCLDGLNPSQVHIAAAGLATQRSSIMCWDKHSGEALSNVISWQDCRAAEWMAQFKDNNTIHEITGLYPSAHYGASKIHWCLQHLPKVRAAHDAGRLVIGPLASFIAYCLCDENPLFTDPSNGGRTLLLNLETIDWDDNLLKLFNIAKDILPQPQNNQHFFGTLNTGHYSIPLTLVIGDQSAAVFHNGTPEENAAYINLGTGAFVQRTLSTILSANHRLLSSIIYHDEQRTWYSLEGTVNGAGSAISWFEQHYDNEKTWQKNFDNWLTSPANKLLFMNTVGGLGSPYWLSNITPQFIGEGSLAEKFCALVESILFLILKNLETFKQNLPPSNHLIVSGGLSQSNALCQRLADLTQTPVQRPEEREATARGTCFLMASPSTVNWKKTDTQTFTPSKDDTLLERYQNWEQQMHQVTSN